MSYCSVSWRFCFSRCQLNATVFCLGDAESLQRAEWSLWANISFRSLAWCLVSHIRLVFTTEVIIYEKEKKVVDRWTGSLRVKSLLNNGSLWRQWLDFSVDYCHRSRLLYTARWAVCRPMTVMAPIPRYYMKGEHHYSVATTRLTVRRLSAWLKRPSWNWGDNTNKWMLKNIRSISIS